MSIIAVLTDKDNDLRIIEDGFKTMEEAKQYMEDRKLPEDSYFATTIE